MCTANSRAQPPPRIFCLKARISGPSKMRADVLIYSVVFGTYAAVFTVYAVFLALDHLLS